MDRILFNLSIHLIMKVKTSQQRFHDTNLKWTFVSSETVILNTDDCMEISYTH